MENQKQQNILTFMETAIKFFDKYGYLRTICSVVMMLFMSYSIYLMMNPSIIFERYSVYEEEKHKASFNYRMESSPKVLNYLNELVANSKCDRAFIIELHNGKYNSAGLSFNYGSLTYEALKEGEESIQEDYADFTLDRFPFIMFISKKGYWFGSINEIEKIDPKMGYKLRSNNVRYMSIMPIYGETAEIGFIGISYTTHSSKIPNNVDKLLYKYSQIISPLLDGSKAFK